MKKIIISLKALEKDGLPGATKKERKKEKEKKKLSALPTGQTVFPDSEESSLHEIIVDL